MKKNLLIVLPVELYDKVRNIAFEMKISMAEFIRRAITESIKKISK